jgi:hypothetical protein
MSSTLHPPNQSLNLQVLQASEMDTIRTLEEELLSVQMPDEMERQIFSWNARWRKESLEHYIPMGWSFCARRGEELTGYFLAQPFLFFDGQTQTLWIEHLQAKDTVTRDALIELAVKLGREKHLQKVLFPSDEKITETLKNYKSEIWKSPILQVRTTKT